MAIAARSASLLALSLAATLLVGCDKPDHPEATVQVSTGLPSDKVNFYQSTDASRPYLKVEGTWTVDGEDKIITPINVSRIECRWDEGSCSDNRAWLLNSGGTDFLSQAADRYEIQSWDNQQLIALAEGECRSIELRIDLIAERVMTLTANNPSGQSSCAPTELLPKPRISRLISSRELEEMKEAGAI